MKYQYLVIIKCDIDPVEVYPFRDQNEANELYEKLRMDWSDVYLAKVLKGPEV